LPAPHDTGPLFTHYIIRKMQGERAGRPKREKCNDESVGHRWNYGDVELQHGIILEKWPRKLPPGRSPPSINVYYGQFVIKPKVSTRNVPNFNGFCLAVLLPFWATASKKPLCVHTQTHECGGKWLGIIWRTVADTAKICDINIVWRTTGNDGHW